MIVLSKYSTRIFKLILKFYNKNKGEECDYIDLNSMHRRRYLFQINDFKFKNSLKELESKGLITYDNCVETIYESKIVPTSKGYTYFVELKNDKHDKFRYSFIYPLIVSLLTALVTSYLANSYLFK